MVVEFPYGSGSISLADHEELKAETIYPTTVAEIQTKDSFRRALSRENGTRSLAHFIQNAKSAAISVEAKHLGSLVEPMLSELVRQIIAGSIPPEDISVIFNKQDLEQSKLDTSSILKQAPLKDCNVRYHDPSDSNTLAWVGETESSNKIMIQDVFVQADFRVGIGGITPDAFIGASGGGTSVLPNIASAESIVFNHRIRLHGVTHFFDTTLPAARDTMEAARLGSLDYIFNCVMNSSEHPASIVAGPFPEAWNQGLQTAERLVVKPTPNSAPIIIVGAGGQPFDNTIYDAADCLSVAERIARHGGTIILVAQCSQGIGAPGLEIGMAGDYDFTLSKALNTAEFQIGMEKAPLLRRILETRNLIIVTDAKKRVVEDILEAKKAKNLIDAIDLALANHPSYPRAVILPDSRFISFN